MVILLQLLSLTTFLLYHDKQHHAQLDENCIKATIKITSSTKINYAVYIPASG
jgi:hypothetical protein